MNITEGIYSKLAGNTDLVTALPEYHSLPNIFAGTRIPENALLPYVVIHGPTLANPFDTKTTRGRETMIDIEVYDDIETGSLKVVEEIAELVRSALHRQPIEVDGTEFLVSRCIGPNETDDENAFGRVISLVLINMEN